MKLHISWRGPLTAGPAAPDPLSPTVAEVDRLLARLAVCRQWITAHDGDWWQVVARADQPPAVRPKAAS